MSKKEISKRDVKKSVLEVCNRFRTTMIKDETADGEVFSFIAGIEQYVITTLKNNERYKESASQVSSRVNVTDECVEFYDDDNVEFYDDDNNDDEYAKDELDNSGVRISGVKINTADVIKQLDDCIKSVNGGEK